MISAPRGTARSTRDRVLVEGAVFVLQMRASEKLLRHSIITTSGMETIRRFDLFKDYSSDRLFSTQKDFVIILFFAFCVKLYNLLTFYVAMYATLYRTIFLICYNLLEYLTHFRLLCVKCDFI